ncbi:toxin-antitoxin system TumE family protein [Paenibacillus oceani]|uniref:toxin-antitoxin system TumE family protein n=1 Tax=Paenibacillus oceani TaxID=2772510 RepID=UPI0037C7E947
MDTRDGDGTGLRSSRKFTRHTFVFVDGSRLLITEELHSGIIDVSYYNWVDSNGNTILCFHSEPHDLNPSYQTATEPHHVHRPTIPS